MRPALSRAARRARRLGLYGGSFDPPHAGHLHCARRAREERGLDHVVLVPAARPPHKPGCELASGTDRAALLELLFADEPWASVWTGELERSGPSYSIDTVRAFRAALPEAELHWILGSDNLPGLAGWREVEELLRLAPPIVVHRRGTELDESLLAPFSEAARAAIRAGYLPGDPLDASASDLRSELASDAPASPLFPRALREYVRSHGIYRARR